MARIITIIHVHASKKLVDKAARENDAFFQIKTGKRKGNSVHVHDIIRYEDVSEFKRMRSIFETANN